MGQNCDNLQSMAGKLICVSPPGTNETGSTNKQFVVKAKAAAIRDTKAITEAEAPTSVSAVASGGGVSVSNLPPLPNASNLPTGESWAWSTVAALSTEIATGNQTQEPTFSWPLDPPVILTESGYIANSLIASAIIARLEYCPFMAENDGQVELDPEWDDLDDDCQSAWEPICDPPLNATKVPGLETVPQSCQPVIVTLTVDGQTSSSTPSSISPAPITTIPSTTIPPKAPSTTMKTSTTTFNPLLGGGSQNDGYIRIRRWQLRSWKDSGNYLKMKRDSG